MIEGTIHGYKHATLESLLTVSFNGPQQGPGVELLHRLGHKIYVLTEDEYRAYVVGKSDEDGYDAGFRDGKFEGRDEGFDDGYQKGHSEGYAEGWDEGRALVAEGIERVLGA
jgi:hypothetical protein